MDDGRLTDSQGRTVNFKNTVRLSFPLFPPSFTPTSHLFLRNWRFSSKLTILPPSPSSLAQVIIMTSNIGAAFLNELPDDTDIIPDSTKDLVNGALLGEKRWEEEGSRKGTRHCSSCTAVVPFAERAHVQCMQIKLEMKGE
jgi:hypothetical protein